MIAHRPRPGQRRRRPKRVMMEAMGE